MKDIQQLGKISLGTALQLFRTKIAPIATYGIELLWHNLNKSNLQEIEKVKYTFLKKILCLSKFTPNRLVYELARESFFIEDLRLHLLLPSTRQYDSNLQEIEEVKSTFLKKILCLSKFTPNRQVYELARDTFFIEDLRLHLLLPSTRQYDSLLQELNTNMVRILHDRGYDIESLVGCQL